MDLAPSASDFFTIFGYSPGFGGTGLQKHCKYLKILKDPKLMAPEPCKYLKIHKILEFSALLASLHARPDTSPEAYSLKNFGFFWNFWVFAWFWHPQLWIFLEFLGIYKDVEVQASRNIVNTQKIQKNPKLMAPKPCKYKKFPKFQSFPHYSLASTPGRIPAPEAYSLKNFRFF